MMLFPSLSVFVVYAGVVPAKNREIGYSIVFIWYSVGHIVEYFISPYILLKTNILLILAVTVVAVSQFSMADYYFGSASSAKCWGRCKQPAAELGEGEAQQANGKPWCCVWLVPSGWPDRQPSSYLCWWPFCFTKYAAKGGSSSVYVHVPGCINFSFLYMYVRE